MWKVIWNAVKNIITKSDLVILPLKMLGGVLIIVTGEILKRFFYGRYDDIVHIKECKQAVFRLLVETKLARAFEIVIPYTTYITFGLTIIIIVCISHKKQRKLPIVCRLAGLSWDINNFCRGWSITGKTGSGKTESAIKQMMFQVFKNYPRWGGLAIDQKGDFYVLMEGFVNRLKIKNKLIVLKTRPEGAPENWTAPAKYNILSYPGIPPTTYASVIVDTGDSVSGGKGEDGAFWKIQSVTNIAAAIELLQTIEEINKTSHIKECIELIPFNNSLRPKGSDEETLYRSDYKEYPKHLSLKNCYTLFNGKNTLKRTMEMYKFIANCLMDRNLINQKIITKLDKVEKDFEEYYKQPETTRGNINSTINNYLARFTSDDIDEVFGAPSSVNTCNFEDIDKGKVFCISMPQKYQLERKYINTIFKLIYYTHALRRFDYPDKLKGNNLLILWADEAQGIVTAAESGMTDYNTIDKTRAARATVVFATQTTTSYIPPLGLDKTKVLLANLANRITFTAADQDGAKMESDMIGKHEVIETSHSYSGGRTTTSKQKKEKAFVTDFELMGLKKFHCIIKHCEKKHKKVLLKPIEYNGKTAEWFSKSQC